jgi:hypothetical protein
MRCFASQYSCFLSTGERNLIHNLIIVLIEKKEIIMKIKEYFLLSVLQRERDNISQELYSCLLKLGWHVRCLIRKNMHLQAYDYIKMALLALLESNNYYYAFLETSHEADSQMVHYTNQLLNYHKKFPMYIFHSLNKSLIGGFQIYCQEVRITFTYQRILYMIENNDKIIATQRKT